jgi:hypothetical protein
MRERCWAPRLSPWWFLKRNGKGEVCRAWLDLNSTKFEFLKRGAKDVGMIQK